MPGLPCQKKLKGPNLAINIYKIANFKIIRRPTVCQKIDVKFKLGCNKLNETSIFVRYYNHDIAIAMLVYVLKLPFRTKIVEINLFVISMILL